MDTVRFLSDLIGEQCIGCGYPIGDRASGMSGLCSACILALPEIVEERCEVCSMPLVSEVRRCVRCRSRNYAFDAHRAAFLYTDLPKRLVQAYKFGERISLSPFFVEAISRSSADLLRVATLLVPVPGNQKRARRRGWSPTDRLCKGLARQHSIPMRRLLVRRHGADQKQLSYSARMETTTERYDLRNPGLDLTVHTAVIVDDVFTTGATASACAALLQRGGAASVYAVTIAID